MIVRRVRRILAVSGALLAAGCAADPISPPATTARGAPHADVQIARPTTPVTFDTDSGTYVLDVAASTIQAPDGSVLALAPDALEYFVTAWQNIQAADKESAEVENEVTDRRAAPRTPAAPCRPSLGLPCTPVDPVRIPRARDGAAPAAQSAGQLTYEAVPLYAITDWNCRDIAIAMRDQMDGYRSARTQYQLALAGLVGAGLKVGSEVNPNPNPGEPYIKPPVTLGQLFSWYATRYAAGGVFEVAAANFQAARARVGFLGTMFNSYDCLNRDWDPPPATAPVGSGGGNGGAGGGTGSVCYFEVTRGQNGEVISTRLLYCRAL